MKLYFHVDWRYVFWLMFSVCVFNGTIFVAHGVLSGKKKHSLSNHFWLWQVIWIINGPAFVTIVMTLFQAFSCRMVSVDNGDRYEFRLIEDTDIICWSGHHSSIAVAAFVGLAIYLAQAALLPSGTFKETMRNKFFDILYVPAYLEGHFFLKALFAAVYVTFFRFEDLLRIPMLLVVNVMLLLLNMHEHPCAIQEINILRTATLSGTVWAGIASLLFVVHIGSNVDGGSDDASPCTQIDKGFLASLCCTGWFAIFSGAAYIAFSNRKPIDSVLAHTFLELERQVEEARKAEKAGPLLGLDNRPLLLDGEIISINDAIKDWTLTSSLIKAESARNSVKSSESFASRARTLTANTWHFFDRRHSSPSEMLSGIEAAPHGNGAHAEGRGDPETNDEEPLRPRTQRRRSIVQITHDALFSSHSKQPEALTDEDLRTIYEQNLKTK